MKVPRIPTVAAFLLSIIGFAALCHAQNATSPTTDSNATIFVANFFNVTAYPAASRGDVAPIALTTDITLPTSIAKDASGKLYLTNSGTNTVTVYAGNANGNVQPIAVIGGSNTQLANPTGIALDADEKIYVLNSTEYPNGDITVYPPLGNRTGTINEAPTATIAGSKTVLDEPTAIALDAHGNIYVTNGAGGPAVPGKKYDPGVVAVYSAGSNGNVAPVTIIKGAKTGLVSPVSIALDSAGNIYVGNASETIETLSGNFTFSSSINIYSAGSTDNAPPIATITGSNTDLGYPTITIDSSRSIYTTGSDGSSINVYPAGSDGNVSPVATIAGANTGVDMPKALALDTRETLYVLNGNGGPANTGSITAYPDGSRGDVTPIATTTSRFDVFNDAKGVSASSGGNIGVANAEGGASETGSVEIYPAGSYATGSPIATISGDETGLYYPSRIALDSNGNIYVLNTSNFPNPGNAVTVYAVGSTGDTMPSATINIDSGGYNTPTGIALGPRGQLYVANQLKECPWQSCAATGAGDVAIYNADSDGNAIPSAVIRGRATELAFPSAIASDQRGGIYVTNEGSAVCLPSCGCFPDGRGSITVYASSSSGNVKPISTISGAKTGLSFPYGITVAPNGNIYVLVSDAFFGACAYRFTETTSRTNLTNADGATASADSIGGPILIFAAGSDGDVAPIGSIGGPLTGLYGPAAIAIGPAGP